MALGFSCCLGTAEVSDGQCLQHSKPLAQATRDSEKEVYFQSWGEKRLWDKREGLVRNEGAEIFFSSHFLQWEKIDENRREPGAGDRRIWPISSTG